MAKVTFSKILTPANLESNRVLIVGQLKNLNKILFTDIQQKLAPNVSEEAFKKAVDGLRPSPTDSCPLWLNSASVAALPVKCSRHNTPSRVHSLSKIVKGFVSGGSQEHIVVVCERSDVLASACGIARVFPLYSGKSGQSSEQKAVQVEFLLMGEGEGTLSQEDVTALDNLAYGVRLAAKLVDIPCADMHTNAFLDEIRQVGNALGIVPLIVQGEELREKGFGGIYNVGKAARNPPALAVLSHTPSNATRTVAWVGKGIVFDTGGLCIKTKAGMCGMKRDCGGAAGILGAFYAAVKNGFSENLHAVFCLAENAVGPDAVRPDDIFTMYSGRTVEINNTDAEGRLVLGDGVAYARKDLKADVVLDMATLTGAQGVATGKYHGALVTNNEDFEDAGVKAGRSCGDLLHAMPYSPELHFPEFSSSLADMKNSVADRSNAQVSCAGLFIGSHLGFDYTGAWLHVDMASPVHSGERATGYGVALLNTLFGQLSGSALVNQIAPPITLTEAMETDAEDGNEGSNKKMKLG